MKQSAVHSPQSTVDGNDFSMNYGPSTMDRVKKHGL